MNTKTNRTRWFCYSVLFGLLSLNTGVPSSAQDSETCFASRLTETLLSDPFECNEQEEVPAQKRRTSAETIATVKRARDSRLVFLVFNNIVTFFKLNQDFANNEQALKVIEDLEVKVSEREVPYNSGRLIPVNPGHEYELETTLPRGYIPTLVATLNGADNRLKAALFKVLSLWTSPFKVTIVYDFYYDTPEQEEYISNLLLDKPEIVTLIGKSAEGSAYEAFKLVRPHTTFKPWSGTFVITLPPLTKEDSKDIVEDEVESNIQEVAWNI